METSSFYFGGGASESSMHPIVVIAMLITVLAVLFAPRRYALICVLVLTFLTPSGQQILVGGFHFFALRLVIWASMFRLIPMLLLRRGQSTALRPGPLDKLLYGWSAVHAVSFILLFSSSGAVVYAGATFIDACGGYVLFRFLIHDGSDVLRTIKSLAIIAFVLSLCMGYEYFTRFNPFSYISNGPIIPLIRDGRVRAQGIFANSITAGIFGATSLPLFVFLWLRTSSKVVGVLGTVASTTIALASRSSTGVLAYIAAVVALGLWPLRRHMQPLRWAIALSLCGLALIMNAPVWFVLARIDLLGGHAWDRSALIDSTIRHFSEWWLLGTKSNANWGQDTWDACNQFVYEATSGGLATLLLFIAILSFAFAMIGRARKRSKDSSQRWFIWCVGAALFAHLVAFIGVDYFDVSRTWWYITLAMIVAASSRSSAAEAHGLRSIRTVSTKYLSAPSMRPV